MGDRGDKRLSSARFPRASAYNPDWVLAGVYGLYCFIGLLFAVVVARATSDLSAPATALSVVATAMFAVPALTVVWHEAFVRESVAPRLSRRVEGPALPGPRPDVYYVVLDMYGRGDVLGALFDVDERPFYAALEALQRGSD